MSKKAIASNQKIFIAISLILILFLALFKLHNYAELHFEGHYDKDQYIDTVFTNGFTFEKFDNIRVGMSKKAVTDIIGEPFEKGLLTSSATVRKQANPVIIPSPDFKQDCWSYSHDGKLGSKGDTSWYSYVLCFKDDTVQDKIVNEFFD